MKLAEILQMPSNQAASYLLGATITSKVGGVMTGGVITEVEAYLATDDLAAHSSRGQTKANQSLYKKPGTLYIHTMRQWVLMDIVTEGSGMPSSILIRAIIPTIGVEEMLRRCSKSSVNELANGPGKVCQTLGITKVHDGTSIFGKQSLVKIKSSKNVIDPNQIIITKRIGISKNIEAPLRFLLKQ